MQWQAIAINDRCFLCLCCMRAAGHCYQMTFYVYWGACSAFVSIAMAKSTVLTNVLHVQIGMCQRPIWTVGTYWDPISDNMNHIVACRQQAMAINDRCFLWCCGRPLLSNDRCFLCLWCMKAAGHRYQWPMFFYVYAACYHINVIKYPSNTLFWYGLQG
jgi:hypothetical protein